MIVKGYANRNNVDLAFKACQFVSVIRNYIFASN